MVYYLESPISKTNTMTGTNKKLLFSLGGILALGAIAYFGLGNFLQSSLLDGGSDPEADRLAALQSYDYAVHYKLDIPSFGDQSSYNSPSEQGWQYENNNSTSSTNEDAEGVYRFTRNTENKSNSYYKNFINWDYSLAENVIMVDVAADTEVSNCLHAEGAHIKIRTADDLEGGVTICEDKFVFTKAGVNEFKGTEGYPADATVIAPLTVEFASIENFESGDPFRLLAYIDESGTNHLLLINKDTGEEVIDVENAFYTRAAITQTADGAGIFFGASSDQTVDNGLSTTTHWYTIDARIINEDDDAKQFNASYNYEQSVEIQKEVERQGWLFHETGKSIVPSPNGTNGIEFEFNNNANEMYLPIDIPEGDQALEFEASLDLSQLPSFGSSVYNYSSPYYSYYGYQRGTYYYYYNLFTGNAPYIQIPTNAHGGHLRIYFSRNEVAVFDNFDSRSEVSNTTTDIQLSGSSSSSTNYHWYLRKIYPVGTNIQTVNGVLKDKNLSITVNKGVSGENTIEIPSAGYTINVPQTDPAPRYYEGGTTIAFGSQTSGTNYKKVYLKNFAVQLKPYIKDRNQENITFSRTYRLLPYDSNSFTTFQGWDTSGEGTGSINSSTEEFTMEVGSDFGERDIKTKAGISNTSLVEVTIDQASLSSPCTRTKNAYIRVATEDKEAFVTICQNELLASSTANTPLNTTSDVWSNSALVGESMERKISHSFSGSTVYTVVFDPGNDRIILKNGESEVGRLENTFYASTANASRLALGIGNATGSDVVWSIREVNATITETAPDTELSNSYSLTPGTAEEGWNFLEFASYSRSVETDTYFETDDYNYIYLPINLLDKDDVEVTLDFASADSRIDRDEAGAPTVYVVNNKYYMEATFGEDDFAISSPDRRVRNGSSNDYQSLGSGSSKPYPYEHYFAKELYDNSEAPAYGDTEEARSVRIVTNDGDLTLYNNEGKVLAHSNGGYRIPLDRDIAASNRLIDRENGKFFLPGIYLFTTERINGATITVNKRKVPDEGMLELNYNAKNVEVSFGFQEDTANSANTALTVNVANFPAAAQGFTKLCIEGASPTCTPLSYNATTKSFEGVLPIRYDSDKQVAWNLTVADDDTGVSGVVDLEYNPLTLFAKDESFNTTTAPARSTRQNSAETGVELLIAGGTIADFNSIESYEVRKRGTDTPIFGTHKSITSGNHIGEVLYSQLETGEEYTVLYKIRTTSSSGVSTIIEQNGQSFTVPQDLGFFATNTNDPVYYQPQVIVPEDDTQYFKATTEEGQSPITITTTELEDGRNNYQVNFFAEHLDSSAGGNVALRLEVSELENPSAGVRTFSMSKAEDTLTFSSPADTLDNSESKTYILRVFQTNGYTKALVEAPFQVVAPLPEPPEEDPELEQFEMQAVAINDTSIKLAGQFRNIEGSELKILYSKASESSSSSTPTFVPTGDGSGTWNFVQTVSGLSPETSYTFKVRFIGESTERDIDWRNAEGAIKTLTTKAAPVVEPEGGSETVVLDTITDNEAPTMELTAPANGANFEATSSEETSVEVTHTWTAEDSDGDALSFKHIWLAKATADEETPTAETVLTTGIEMPAGSAESMSHTHTYPIGDYWYLIQVSDGKVTTNSEVRGLSITAFVEPEPVEEPKVPAEVTDNTDGTSTVTMAGIEEPMDLQISSLLETEYLVPTITTLDYLPSNLLVEFCIDTLDLIECFEMEQLPEAGYTTFIENSYPAGDYEWFLSLEGEELNVGGTFTIEETTEGNSVSNTVLSNTESTHTLDNAYFEETDDAEPVISVLNPGAGSNKKTTVTTISGTIEEDNIRDFVATLTRNGNPINPDGTTENVEMIDVVATDSSWSIPVTLAGPTEPGVHTYTVTLNARDIAFNEAAEVTRTFTVETPAPEEPADEEAPVWTLTSPAEGDTTLGTIRGTIQDDSALEYFQYRLNTEDTTPILYWNANTESFESVDTIEDAINNDIAFPAGDLSEPQEWTAEFTGELAPSTTYSLIFLYRDEFNNQGATAPFTFTTEAAPDTEGPSIEIASPSENGAIAASITSIFGTANDEMSDVELVEYSLFNGTHYYAETDGVFGWTSTDEVFHEITLDSDSWTVEFSEALTDEGSYTFKLRAVDTEGNPNQKIRTFNIETPESPDTTEPVLSLTSPTAEATTLSSIAGTVVDAESQITSLTYAIKRESDGLYLGTEGAFIASENAIKLNMAEHIPNPETNAEGSFSKEMDLVLSAGTNFTVTVFTTNEASLTTEASVSFSTPEEDTEGPNVSIVNPIEAGNEIVASMTGTILDNVAVASSEFSLKKGETWLTSLGENGAFNGTAEVKFPLTINAANTFGITKSLTEAGEYTLTVYAVDTAGNLGSDTATFTLLGENTDVDTTKPELAITKPSIESTSLTKIEGTVKDEESAITSFTYSLKNEATGKYLNADGAFASDEEVAMELSLPGEDNADAFSKNISASLPAGTAYTLKVTATNEAELTESKTVEFTTAAASQNQQNGGDQTVGEVEKTENNDGTTDLKVDVSDVSFENKDGKMEATIDLGKDLPAEVDLKICYRLSDSIAAATCVDAERTDKGVFLVKTEIAADTANLYDWQLVVGDTPLNTKGTLGIEPAADEPIAVTITEKDENATIKVQTESLKPAATSQEVTMNFKSITWERVSGDTMNARIVMNSPIARQIPIAMCYAKTGGSAVCATAGAVNDRTYLAQTSIKANENAVYAWVIAANNEATKTSGSLVISGDAISTDIKQNDSNQKLNVPSTLLASTAPGYIQNVEPIQTVGDNTGDNTTTGTTQFCPPTCPSADSSLVDVDSSNFAYVPILALQQRAIMTGYPDRTFRPGNPVNRAEFAKLTKNTYLIETANSSAAPDLVDVRINDWFYQPVRALNQIGLFTGYQDRTFRAGNSILRSEAAKVIAVATAMAAEKAADSTLTDSAARAEAERTIATEYNFFRTANPSFTYAILEDVPVDNWYAPYVYYAVRNGLITGREVDGRRLFAPGEQILRGEAATLLARVIEKLGLTYPVETTSAGTYQVQFPE